MPLRVYYDLLGRLSASSREYAVLRESLIEPVPAGDYNVETCCDVDVTEQLLERARQFCPQAVPFIEKALASAGAHATR
jgi:hypothetical protein